MDYTAIGDTVNLASRLEGVALPGHILISKEMKERLGRRISASYAGEFHLKGKKDKVPAYMVNGIEEQQAEEEVDLSKDDYRYGRLYCIPSLQQLEEFQRFVMPLDEPPSVLIEVRCYEDLLLSVEFMKENGIYPFGGR